MTEQTLAAELEQAANDLQLSAPGESSLTYWQIATILTRAAALARAAENCANDLEAEIEHRYTSIKDHPAIKPRYERDMQEVRDLRALLSSEGKGE